MQGIALKKIAAILIIIVGFLSGAAAAFQSQSARSVAITFDDLPGVVHAKGDDLASIQKINRKLLLVLTKHHVPATGFVIGSNSLGRADTRERVGVLQEWLSAGMEIGNHTYSHLDFNNVTLGEFERDTVRDEGALRPLLEKNSRPLRFFRFPYNHVGDTSEKKQEFQRFLAEHHYEIATCTVENADWAFDVVYYDNMSNRDAAGMQK